MGSEPPPPPPLKVCESLGLAAPGSACADLVQQRVANQENVSLWATSPPLRSLLDAEGGEVALGLYAEGACAELAAAVREATPIGKGSKRETKTYVGVFGLAGYTHAVAHAVACASGMDAAEIERMLDVGLGDVEGLLVPLFGGPKPCLHLKRPK